MTPRIKKLLGGAAIIVFVVLYCAAAATLVDRVPTLWCARLAYFLVVGVAWGLPVIPLMTWMNRER